jgi:hypothetical protein
MTTLDVVILVSVLPVLPVLIAPWLPWERWVPWAKLPRLILGPYALYVAFASVYFGFPRWMGVALSVIGVVLIVIAIVERRRRNLVDESLTTGSAQH